MNRKRAALFDLDGVIIDTEGSYTQFWGSMGREYNVGVPDFEYIIKGTTLTQILDKYFPDPIVKQEVIDKLISYEQGMDYQIFAGTIELLESLRQGGIPSAIVTSSNDRKMSNLWRQHPDLRSYFSAIITDEWVTRSKPDPQCYIIAAQELGCQPQDCFVFEDSFNGIESGRRSGAKVIALATTNPAESLEGKADIVLPSIASVTMPTLLSL